MNLTFIVLAIILAVNANAQGPKGPPPRGGSDAYMAKLADELGLTKEQRAKYDAANAATSKRFREIHEGKVNGTLTQEQVLKQALETHKALTAKMKEILTPEQFAKWEPAREAHHKQVIAHDKQRESESKP